MGPIKDHLRECEQINSFEKREGCGFHSLCATVRQRQIAGEGAGQLGLTLILGQIDKIVP